MRGSFSECTLILAPKGRDAFLAERILRDAGIVAEICRDIPTLLVKLEGGAGVAVLTEEAIRNADIKGLANWVGAQPPWSDFPFVLITSRGAGMERNPVAERQMETLGNVSFLERPFHPTTLVSVVKAGLRTRRRQYEARVRVQVLQESEEKFRNLAETIPTLCWMAEPDGYIFWYNQRWYDYTGTSLEQMKGWGWQSVHDPQTLPSVLDRWKASLASGDAFEMVFPLRGADGIFRPFLTRMAPIKDSAGNVIRWFGTNTDISVQKRQEDHLNFLMHEIAHRSKNLLAVIQSMIRQTAQSTTTVSEFSLRLSDRILGLASTHDQLLKGDWKGASLSQLITNQLKPFGIEDQSLELSGPEIQVRPKVAEALGLAFHELATNAAKHGALAQPSGTIRVYWEIGEDPNKNAIFRLTWQEFGVRIARTPRKKGFGNVVLTRIVAGTLFGKVALDYGPEGVCWSIECPVNEVIMEAQT